MVLAVAAPAQRASTSADFGQPTQLACAPRMHTAEPDLSLTPSGSQDDLSRCYYGPHDTLVISGGSDPGVQIGQEYFVRRVTAPSTTHTVPPSDRRHVEVEPDRRRRSGGLHRDRRPGLLPDALRTRVWASSHPMGDSTPPLVFM